MRSVAAWAWRRLQSTSSLLPRPAGLRATAGTCAPTAPEICAGKWHQSSSFTWSTPRGKAPPGVLCLSPSRAPPPPPRPCERKPPHILLNPIAILCSSPGEHISSQVAAPRSRERPDGNPAGPFESPGSGRLGDTAKALKDLAAAQSSEAVAAAVERAGGPASLPPGVLAKALQALARCRASRDPTVLRHSLLQRLEREIALRAGCFVAHDITACAAALAKLGLGNAAVFTALQRRAMELQADLSPRVRAQSSLH